MPHSEALGKEGWLEARVAGVGELREEGCGVLGSELQTGSSQAAALPMTASAGRCTTVGGRWRKPEAPLVQISQDSLWKHELPIKSSSIVVRPPTLDSGEDFVEYAGKERHCHLPLM